MNFILIGAAGYIAPKHMRAIKEIGGNLLACLDKSDSVGIIDSYFPDCEFFTEFERFDRHVFKLQSSGCVIDYASICSPNYLHDSHIRWALRMGINAICEKPLVLNPDNLRFINMLENQSGKKAYSILQLRLHPLIEPLSLNTDKVFIDIDYQTPRGKWYLNSWKGEVNKSGGLITNIGIHFLDLLTYLYGSHKSFCIDDNTPTLISGQIELEKALCMFRLSIQQGEVKRIFKVNGKQIDLSESFADLHAESYKQIISGNGYTFSDCLPSIKLAHEIRNS